MKYVAIGWPEIQDYMNNPDYPERCCFDPKDNVWLIPEDWDPDYLELKEVKENVFKSMMDDYSELGGDIGDLDDALG
jgi:hypothetical protein